MSSGSIIFDLDGTLVDSSAGILESLSAAFQAEGIEPSQSLSPALIGPPLASTLQLLAPHLDEKQHDRLANAFKAHYDTFGILRTQPYPGVQKMLQTIADAELRMDLVTNKRQQPTAKILEAQAWNQLFEQTLSPDSFQRPMPSKPKLLAHLLDDAALNPQHCLYVGDRLDDFLAAQHNDICFVFAEWGYEQNERSGDPAYLSLKVPDPELLIHAFRERAASI
jgi:phosphoglycolate phosphatase